MHQPVENGGGHGVVSQIFPPILHDAVRCHDDAASEFVALVNQHLQQFSGAVADASGQKQIVKYHQIGIEQWL